MASFENAGNDDSDEEHWTRAWDDGTNSLIVQQTERRPRMTSQIKESLVEQNSVNVDIPKVSAQSRNCDVMITAMALNDNKAGMEGLDKESINRIIHEASKGSSFYENEKRKEEMTNQRIQMQNDKLKKLTTDQIALGISKADDLLEMLESSRDLSRTIVHIDMDAFYAAVEMLEKPEWKDKPMAVGGSSMISTSNYAARRFGVRAGMPGFIGRKLCPELVLVPCNFEKYGNFSRRIRKIFAEYDPNFSPVGLDEAYLDLTNYLISLKDGTSQSSDDQISVDDSSTVVQERSKTDAQTPMSNSEGQACDDQAHISDDQAHMSHDQAQMSHDQAHMSHDQAHMSHDQAHTSDSKEADRDHESGSSDPQEHASLAAKVVDEIRSRIFKETGLTASAGIAANSMLAKVCSDRNKPNGQFEIESTKESVHEFIRDLPIRKICGIGKVTEKMLKALGIVTCQQLHDKRGVLYHLYSSISFDYFMRIALGIGATRIERDCERKSMSVERTFSEMNKPSQLQDMCWQLSEMLSEDLSNEDMMGKTVTLKIKTVKFEVKTRAHTLPSHTQSAEQIFGAASSLLKTEIKACLPAPLRLRLMGVRLSSLLPAADVPSRNQTTISSMMKRQTMSATATLEASQTANSEMDATCSAANIISPTETDSNDSTISIASEISECETVVENGASEFVPCSIKTFVCPICNIAQPTEGLIDLNRHIDECLNRRQVREILADDSKKKKSRCDELPEATNGKRQKLNKSKPASAGSLLKYFNSNG